jgi:serine/threonine protein kinase
LFYYPFVAESRVQLSQLVDIRISGSLAYVSTNTSIIMEAYSVGRRLKFDCSEPNTLTEQLGSRLFEVEITKQLGVWTQRRSQVVLVRVTDDSKDLTFVAKCFDPMLQPPVDPIIYPDGPQQRCSTVIRAESVAYETLHQLQGVHIPKFYGRYHYTTDLLPYGSEAILLEAIEIPSLETISSKELTLDELSSLENLCYSVLNKVHTSGIYQLDISPTNTFWDRANLLMFCDFEDTIKHEDSIEAKHFDDYIYLDKGRVQSMLWGLGMPRPPIPPSFYCISSLT